MLDADGECDHSVAQQCVDCCKGDTAIKWEREILGMSRTL